MSDIYLLPIPGSAGELRALPIHVKPDWRGVVAWIVGASLWLMEIVRIRWATRIMDDWVQVISGRVYLQRGRDVAADPPSKSLLGHEAIHDWQARKFGKIRYTLNYAFRRKMRRHYEAMAYGYQVAEWGRHPENAATSASKPIYGMKWTRAEARELIDAYAEAFTVLWRLSE
jgi:hypothetical protein